MKKQLTMNNRTQITRITRIFAENKNKKLAAAYYFLKLFVLKVAFMSPLLFLCKLGLNEVKN